MNKNDKFHGAEFGVNAQAISDDELDCVAGGSEEYPFVCPYCNERFKFSGVSHYTDGSFNENSDFDCWLIGRDENRARHDTSIVNGIELQAEIYPLHYFMNLPMRRAAEQDFNGDLRGHLMLFQTVEAWCDFSDHVYLGAKKTLRRMEQADPDNAAILRRTLRSFDISDMRAWISRLRAVYEANGGREYRILQESEKNMF